MWQGTYRRSREVIIIIDETPLPFPIGYQINPNSSITVTHQEFNVFRLYYDYTQTQLELGTTDHNLLRAPKVLLLAILPRSRYLTSLKGSGGKNTSC